METPLPISPQPAVPRRQPPSTLAADTEPWADKMQIDLLRQAGPTRRLMLAFELSAMSWNAARAGIDRLYPEEPQDRRDRRFLSSIYGTELAEDFIAYRQKIEVERRPR